jgi:Protein of unknown function (DUF2938)
MNEVLRFWLCATAAGVAATAVMDASWLLLQRFAGMAAPDYGLVGRWIGYMPRGRFRHDAIAQAAPVRHEGTIGWTAHYLIGIAYAALLLALTGLDWLRQPTLGAALAVGLATVAAPFLLMQPGMGAGFFASRTPRPAIARARSLLSHALFGLGLYAAGWLLHFLFPISLR